MASCRWPIVCRNFIEIYMIYVIYIFIYIYIYIYIYIFGDIVIMSHMYAYIDVLIWIMWIVCGFMYIYIFIYRSSDNHDT